MLLISAGVLGALPLSGVVSPFLSSGNTAMLANFLIFALLLSISAGKAAPEDRQTFRQPVRWSGIALAVCGLVLVGFAARYQAIDDREYLARDTHVFEDDGIKRAQHNPRINSIAREIPRGDIFDRNGILLATRNWKKLAARRAQYQALGIDIEQAC